MVSSRFLYLTATFLAASAEIVTLTPEKLYDDPSRSLSEVACWRKNTGFMPNLNWRFQKDAVAFIGIPDIKGPGSAACFSCWQVNYHGVVKHFLALDRSDSDFVVSTTAMQSLTSEAQELTSLDAHVTEVDTLNCGISMAELHEHDF
ncbi:Cerato-platanin domain-containing protein [Trichoderma chlorosporum]